MSKSKLNILFFTSGSIAAYKGATLVSRLVKAGHSVRVIATHNALNFVGTSTWEGLTGQRVVSDTFANGEQMAHIHLRTWADLGLVYPASANLINQLAQGLAPDMVSTTLLAWDFNKPLWLAPAMNPSMYLHPTTQASLGLLSSFGYHVLPVAQGSLACGETGPGRVLEPDEVYNKILSHRDLTPQRILVTSGGTEEPIDGVRTISNLSSGRTGAQIANALVQAGHHVTLLHGRRSLQAQFGVRHLEYSDYPSLKAQMTELLLAESFAWVIHAAAVSDYSVANIQIGEELFPASTMSKLPSDTALLKLCLSRNPKLLPKIKSWSCNPSLKVVGFKLTQNASPAQQLAAVTKLFQAGSIDYVVHNDLSKIEGRGDGHLATLFNAQGPLATVKQRHELTQMLVDLVARAQNPTEAEAMALSSQAGSRNLPQEMTL